MKKLLAAALAVLVVLMGLPLIVVLIVTMLASASGQCTGQAATTMGGTSSTALGNLGVIDGPVGASVTGAVELAQANIPDRSGLTGFDTSMPRVLSRNPDFVTLNEVSGRSDAEIRAAAPGYQIFRAPEATGPGGSQSLGNAVLWKAGTWTMVNSGQVKIVEDDQSYYDGRPVTWDRFAVWVMLRRPSDGAVVSVVGTHQMINPARYPAQHDNPPLTRAQQYGAGMDVLVELAASLAAHGPVLIGGDMNTHADQIGQSWSAAAKMSDAGYGWYVHDIDFVFYPRSQGVRLAGGATGPMVSDHQWVSARLDMNDAGPVPLPVGPTSSSTASPPDPDVMTPLMQLQLAPGYPTLTRDQAADAVTIAQVARDLQVSRFGLQVALVTAIQESGLVDLDHGDADSLGLFQQRPSMGWGTAAQIMDPALATQAFFGRAPQTGNPGLLDIPGWQNLSLAQAAQAVQRSGAPYAYARWEQVAGDIADLLGGDLPAGAGTQGTGADCAPSLDVVDEVTIATLNLLGASHTDGRSGRGADSHEYPGWATRLPGEMAALQDAGASVATLQEVQQPQADAIADRYSKQWGMYPATGSAQNRIIYDRNAWQLTQGRIVDIPYFGGQPAQTPLVLLTSPTTGQSIWVLDMHNPADTRGDASTYRDQALRIELNVLKDAIATGTPTVVAGDANDADDGRAASQCVLTPTLMNSFSPPGPVSRAGPASADAADAAAADAPCARVTGDAPVDHIYGANLTWSSAHVDHATQTGRVSDHPLVVATAAGTRGGCALNAAAAPSADASPTSNAERDIPTCSQVVYPVPDQYIASDEHNWHESGPMWSHWHSGTDFGVPCGTPVYAAHAGTIEIDTTQAWAGPWLVKVSSGPTSLTTWYAHMERVLVTPGQTVGPGEQIGLVGQEGNASGCHLHFEVHLRNGSIYGPDNVDPSTWLAQHAQSIGPSPAATTGDETRGRGTASRGIRRPSRRRVIAAGHPRRLGRCGTPAVAPQGDRGQREPDGRCQRAA